MKRLGTIRRTATFDQTGQYRYWLTREWDTHRPAIALIMLNPSRANERQDDPTIRRCIQLAHQWGYGRLIIVNLFGYCTASPQTLKVVSDPIGVDNDDYILQASAAAEHIALAWGNWGRLHQRDQAVLKLLQPNRDRLVCCGYNRTGQPRHPLYLPRQTPLQPW